MLTRKKVLSLALTLTKAGDSDLIRGDGLFAGEDLSDVDKARVRDVVEVVHDVCADYSYLRSAAFATVTLGKSESFVSMKAKMETAPPKKKERLEELFAAIRNVQHDPKQLFELVRQDQYASVDRLLGSLKALNLPSE